MRAARFTAPTTEAAAAAAAAASAPHRQAREHIDRLRSAVSIGEALLGDETPTRVEAAAGLRDVACLLELLQDHLWWSAGEARRRALDELWETRS